MSEVSFAKGFLATLDKRPIKLPADHVSDPRKYPNQSPFTLPRPTHPFPRKARPATSQGTQAATISATLKPMRAGDTVTLSDITLDTTIHDIKSQYAQKSNQPQDKIKLLLNKKPAADLKTLKELGVQGDVELSVMLMGGAATTPVATPATEKAEPPLPVPAPPSDKMDIDSQGAAPESEKAQAEAQAIVTPADTAAAILRTEDFWTDLKGFLTQRLRDQSEAEKMAQVFRDAYSKR